MKNKFRVVLSFFAVAFCAVALVGCKCNDDKNERTVIKMAGVGPLAGDVAIYGNTTKQGIELAVEEINAAGGIKVGDKMMKIEWLGMIDDEANPDKAANAFNTQYNKGIDFMLGAVTSGATEGLIGQAIGKEIIVMTPTGTADYLTAGAKGDERDLRQNVFRTCFNDSYQGTIAAKFMKENLNAKKVAVIYNNEESYSTGLLASFKEYANANGLEIVSEQAYQKNTSDFNSYWNNVPAGTEAVFIPDYYEKVVAIVAQGRDKGFTGAMVGADGWDGVLGVENVDANDFVNCYFTNHFAADSTEEKVKNFVERFKAKYNEAPSSFATLGYDAVYVYKAAVEKAQSIAYADVLAVLSDPNFKVECVTGNIWFKDGNAQKAAVVMTFENGAYKYSATVQ